MKIFYNIGISIYNLIAWIYSFFNEKARKFVSGRKGVFELLEKKVDSSQKYVWIHAASLGEFEQGRPIIEKIKSTQPGYKILLTFFSPSGYEVRKDYKEADIICYLPTDLPWNAKRFLDIVQPKAAIFIKYEFWMNYLSYLKERQVPTYIVSAIFRPSQLFFQWYGRWYADVLKNFTHLFVQNQASKDLLESIGITDNVSLVGDTRFDRVADIAEKSKPLPIVDAFSQGEKVFIAGSSWPKDEDILIPYVNEHPDIKFIIAPHEIHDGHLQRITSQLKGKYALYTKTNQEDAVNAQCLIVDCFGLLSSIYRYGRIAYIGGGFGVGIHNILEASVYGIPILFGPNYKKFKEAVDMVELGGAYPISDGQEFKAKMEELIRRDSQTYKQMSAVANQYSKTNRGATEKVMKEIFKD